MPMLSDTSFQLVLNKKILKIYNDNGYTIVFNKQILNDDFKLAMGSD